MIRPMLRTVTIIGTAFLLGSSCDVAPKAKVPPAGVKAPGLPAAYAAPAVDHEVTYAFWRGFGPNGGDRITVWRHGSLLRQVTQFIGSKRDSDPATETVYSNLATGASALETEHGPGEAIGLTFW